MTSDPFQRFLGMSASASPLALLGLTPQRSGPSDVTEALRARLAQVNAHPEAGSPEAEHVRRALEDSARRLAGPPVPAAMRADRHSLPVPAHASFPRRSRRGDRPMRLTPFDRQVMAALVGCGGWNARSRAMLVSLAVAYGVTVQGLIKVVCGLSEYAKSGGPRLGVAEITAGAPRMRPPSAPPPEFPESPEPPESEAQWLARMAPELRGEGTPWGVARLAAFFGVLAILVGSFIAWQAMRSDPAPTPPRRAPAEAPAARPPPVLDSPHQSAEDDSPRMLAFDRVPTFSIDELPQEAIDALDASPALAADLARLARHIIVSEGEPPEPVYRAWADDMSKLGACWPLLDPEVRQAIDHELLELLRAAEGAPAVVERLLLDLTPPSSISADALEVWRGAWAAGVLGRMAGSDALAPTIREPARHKLAVARPGGPGGPGGLVREPAIDELSFDTAAGAWLDALAPQLAARTADDSPAYLEWELWLEAQRHVRAGEPLNAAIASALEALLRTDIDLVENPTAISVLGRLVLELDFTGSAAVRQRMRSMLDADSGVESRDLWVLTSLLAQSPASTWFEERLVVAPDADWKLRQRLWQEIEERWPEASASASEADRMAGGLAVDAAALARWNEIAARAAAEPIALDAASLMRQLVIACWVNEAAAELAIARLPQSRAVMSRIEESLSAPMDAAALMRIASPAALRTAPEPGQVIGTDGQWATQHEALGNDNRARVESLQALRRSAGTDLGPMDATLLAQEAMRGRTDEIRTIAQAVIANRFATGPNMAMAMLDGLPDSPVNEELSQTISRMTERSLPGARSSTWPAEARLALLEHALRLRGAAANATDILAAAVAESCANQAAAAAPNEAVPPVPRDVVEAAERVRARWHDAADALTDGAASMHLVQLDRRSDIRMQLATGPIQRYVALRAAAMELLAVLARHEQPGRAAEIDAIIAESAARRSELSHALAQAVEIERSIARLWQVRLVPAEVAAATARAGGSS